MATDTAPSTDNVSGHLMVGIDPDSREVVINLGRDMTGHVTLAGCRATTVPSPVRATNGSPNLNRKNSPLQEAPMPDHAYAREPSELHTFIGRRVRLTRGYRVADGCKFPRGTELDIVATTDSTVTLGYANDGRGRCRMILAGVDWRDIRLLEPKPRMRSA